jgi:deoxycytidine triphosphate deaminase
MVRYSEHYLWSDPLSDATRPGVLLSDEIRLFVDCVHLIAPFSIDDLRPAAYDLHIGETYYVDDQPVSLGHRQWFRVPANGLVYVKTRESFNIPYYMVARYSLRVTQVYRGLLIDNGLHIDPGYHGPIYVPVHNFADQDRTLSEGDAFLSVEFARTTPLPAQPVERIGTELDLLSTYGKDGVPGQGGYKVFLFNKSPKDLRKPPKTPTDFWNRFPGEEHKSAMIGQLTRVQEEVTGQLKRLRNLGYAGILTIVVALFAAVFPWISSRYLETERAYKESVLRLQVLSDEVKDLRQQLETKPEPASQAPAQHKGNAR